jgi:hypothetical protein
MRWLHHKKQGFQWWTHADFVIEERFNNVRGEKVETFYLFVNRKYTSKHQTLQSSMRAAATYIPPEAK